MHLFLHIYYVIYIGIIYSKEILTNTELQKVGL